MGGYLVQVILMRMLFLICLSFMRRACVYANDGVLLNLYKRITSVLLMFCCFLCTPVIMSHYLHVALRRPVAFCGPVDCYTGAIILTVCVGVIVKTRFWTF